MAQKLAVEDVEAVGGEPKGKEKVVEEGWEDVAARTSES